MALKDLLNKLPRRSLRVDIMTAFLVLLFTSTITIISYTYKRNSEIILNFARESMSNVSTSAIAKLTDLIKDAESAVQTGSSILNEPEKATPKHKDLIDFMFAMLTYNPHIQNYYFGMENGSFLELSRLEENNQTIFRIRHIDRRVSPATAQAIFFNEEGRSLSERSIKPFYDPRTRPWFIRAPDRKLSPSTIYEIEPEHENVYWTDTYSFEEKGQTGISVSNSVHDYEGKWIGVVGADVTLEGIARFLQKQKIGKSGSEIIIDKSGDVIASPFDDYDQRDDKLHSVVELHNPIYQRAFTVYESNNEIYFSFEHEGTEYLASATPFTYQNFPNEWIVLIVVPINDFLGETIKIHRDNLFISGGVVLLSIIAIIFLSREISRPIIKLAHQIDEIKQFHLENPIETKSSIKEIYLISNATKRMQEAIQTFSFYVPKELVQKLITQGEALELGGRSQEMTIFFSDIVGFTEISEQISPDQLMLQLSEYLDEISKVLLELEGTIDKYIGDNVMAFWGAPAPDDEHFLHACEAALISHLVVDKLNQKWEQENKPPFRTKIGIHMDQVIVGNIGTHERRNYTIIGDGVNLAARLETVNRFYQTKTIISEQLQKKIESKFLTRPVDIIAVKGKKDQVKIYELIGMYERKEIEPSQNQKDLAEKFTKVFDLYINQNWKEALSILETLDEKDHLTQIYIQRCRELIEKNPTDWDPATQLY